MHTVRNCSLLRVAYCFCRVMHDLMTVESDFNVGICSQNFKCCSLSNYVNVIAFKGSPQSVERARFLVTEALNSPSIFQNQGRNNITLGGFIEQKTLTSATTTSSLPQHQSTVAQEADSPLSKQSFVMTTTSPCTSASNSSTSPSNGSISRPAVPTQITSQSFAPHPVHSQVSTNRVSYSKVTSGAWHNSQKMKTASFIAKVL